MTTSAMTHSEILPAFFSSLGLSVDNRHYSHFRYSHSATSDINHSDNMIAVLSHYALLAVDGPDAGKFLQGQTTCNVDEVDDDHSRPGAYCTVKGRMIASFQLARTGAEQYLLRMHRPLVARSQQVLAKYIVFSKAQLTDASEHYIAIGLHGTQAAANILQSFGHSPAGLNQSVSKQNNVVIQLDEDGLSFECWITIKMIDQLWPILSKGMHLQGSDSWELLCIRRGQGEVCEPTVESFIPQMLNYQITGAVSFSKGCYTGQEVVARMQYRGKLKRRMYRVQIASTSVLPAAPLIAAEGEQSIGNIVNAVRISDTHTEALAVISNKHVELDSVYLGSDKLSILTLPYSAQASE